MRGVRKRARLALAGASVLTGCSGAPSVDILGSFFPIWMVCVSVAVILAFLARKLLLRSKLESHVGPVALFYPSLVVLLSCLLWLIFFR
jgi:YtcA-like protein